MYTVCTEGELFYAPIYENGTVNLEEFDFVDFWESDVDVKELEKIQSTLIDMMTRAGLYFNATGRTVLKTVPQNPLGAL